MDYIVKKQTRSKPSAAKNKKNAPYVYIIRRVFVITLALAVVSLAMLLIAKPSSSARIPFEEGMTMQAGVTVNGIDVSGMTYNQARQVIYDAANEALCAMAISVSDGTTAYVFTSADIDAVINIDDTLTAAMSYGRYENAVKALSHTVVMSESHFQTTWSFDELALRERIDAVSELFFTPATEPFAVPVRLSASPEFAYHDGVSGRKVDNDALFDAIADALRGSRLNEVITPVFTEILPEGNVGGLESVTKLRSRFETTYASGSLKAPSRTHNIDKGARLLNGCVVMPGEEFSFNDYIGPRTYEGGWQAAPGIVNGNTYEMQAGGGICQISTTLHNAVMLAGPELDVTVRKNHSWPSSYVDTGLDATVSTGGPDFKFVNNTEAPIYIFAYADNKNYVMTVYIYGEPLPEGVTYKVRAVQDSVTEPQPDIIIEEPSWPEGYTRTTIQSRKGVKTTAYRDKLLNGTVVETETLYSYNYRAIRGEIHVGTGDPSLPTPAE